MGIYRKLPVEIEARRYVGGVLSADGIMAWISALNGNCWCRVGSEGLKIVISTLEGEMEACRGDWVVKGVKGEFYPVKDDIFRETYEAVGISDA